MQTTKEVLVKAKNLIESRGWTQNWFSNSAGCLCVLGAIRAAVIDRPFANCSIADGFLIEDATAVVVNVTQCPTLAEWNDEPDRTVFQVLQAFDLAIAVA